MSNGELVRGGGQPPQQPQPPPNVIEKFLENQSKEIDLRVQQNELEEKKQAYWLEYSTKSLQTQFEDRESERNHVSRRGTKLLWFLGVVLFLVLAFLAYVIRSGNAQIALELVRVVIYGGAGYIGGWGVAKSKSPRQPPQNAPNG